MSDEKPKTVKVQCRCCPASWEVRHGATYWPFCAECIKAGRSYEYLQNRKVNRKPVAE